jgi:hypothetical protein
LARCLELLKAQGIVECAPGLCQGGMQPRIPLE